MAPPMPMPVRNRIAVIDGTDQAKADSTENRPMKPTLMTSSGLRPKRSPSGPESSAPTRMPTLDITKAMVNCGGGTPQAFDSEGAAMPMVPRSKPSKACTSAQSKHDPQLQRAERLVLQRLLDRRPQFPAHQCLPCEFR